MRRKVNVLNLNENVTASMEMHGRNTYSTSLTCPNRKEWILCFKTIKRKQNTEVSNKLTFDFLFFENIKRFSSTCWFNYCIGGEWDGMERGWKRVVNFWYVVLFGFTKHIVNLLFYKSNWFWWIEMRSNYLFHWTSALS